MKKKFLFPVLLTGLFLLGGCNSKTFIPSHGGVVDTLHNEIHVDSYADLLDLEPGQGTFGKDPTKVYYTDDDGLSYKYDESRGGYYCVAETNTTINFYFDSTQTTDEDGNDAPIFSIQWYLLKPLGEIPEEINSLEKVLALGAAKGFAPTTAFPTFIGFSAVSTCLDETGLWNYETDYRQQAVTNLFGIWVAE